MQLSKTGMSILPWERALDHVTRDSYAEHMLVAG